MKNVDYSQLEELIGYQFQQVTNLCQALTHKSYHHENTADSLGHNERLEFLGDAVLDLVLSDLLMIQFPGVSEGVLSRLRASFVNETVLAEMACEYKLDEYLRLGRGELRTGGSTKPRLLASAFEAFIGALYRDSDYKTCYEFISKVFAQKIAQIDLENQYATDYKTRLQEVAQQIHKQTPSYQVVEETGPDHQKFFTVEVIIGTKILAKGEGPSKKLAAQSAAKNALGVLVE